MINRNRHNQKCAHKLQSEFELKQHNAQNRRNEHGDGKRDNIGDII